MPLLAKSQRKARAKCKKNERRYAEQQRLARAQPSASAQPEFDETEQQDQVDDDQQVYGITEAQWVVQQEIMTVASKLPHISLDTIHCEAPLELARRALAAEYYLPYWFAPEFIKLKIAMRWPWLFINKGTRSREVDTDIYLDMYAEGLKTRPLWAVERGVTRFVQFVHVTYSIRIVCKAHCDRCDDPSVVEGGKQVALVRHLDIELDRFGAGCTVKWDIGVHHALRHPGPAELAHSRSVQEWAGRVAGPMLDVKNPRVGHVKLASVAGCVFCDEPCARK